MREPLDGLTCFNQFLLGRMMCHVPFQFTVHSAGV